MYALSLSGSGRSPNVLVGSTPPPWTVFKVPVLKRHQLKYFHRYPNQILQVLPRGTTSKPNALLYRKSCSIID